MATLPPCTLEEDMKRFGVVEAYLLKALRDYGWMKMDTAYETDLMDRGDSLLFAVWEVPK